MKVLFVCSANKVRSFTAELALSELYPEHEFDSAGTNHKECIKDGTTPLEESHLQWADIVLVMQGKHRDIIKKHTGKKYSKKIFVLGIEDIYDPFERELVDILKKKTKRHLSTSSDITMLPHLTQPKVKDSYILSIGDILISSEDILNSPSIGVSMHYHDIPSIFESNQRVLSAIKYEELRVELKYDEELAPQITKLMDMGDGPAPKHLDMAIIKNDCEVYSVGIVSEVFTSEKYMGFVFVPNFVTSQ